MTIFYESSVTIEELDLSPGSTTWFPIPPSISYQNKTMTPGDSNIRARLTGSNQATHRSFLGKKSPSLELIWDDVGNNKFLNHSTLKHSIGELAELSSSDDEGQINQTGCGAIADGPKIYFHTCPGHLVVITTHPSKHTAQPGIDILKCVSSFAIPGSINLTDKSQENSDLKKILDNINLVLENHDKKIDTISEKKIRHKMISLQDIFTDLVYQTNLYSFQQTGRFIQASGNEMRDFISIHILMGIVEMPCYLDYWNNKFRYSQIADTMTFLHFTDNHLQDSDRYYNVRPIAEKIRINCLKLENVNKFSIDEMMIPYEGRKARNKKQ
uniref:SFRICE_013754 n=1 Tax=Spodoptera frugiperda TaxID=7108 RepID=A0A2H1W8J0_SPOFR